MFFGHGLSKVLNFSEKSATFPDPLGVGSTLSLALAVFGEVVCPIAIALGLKTRWAAIPAAVTMFVAGVIHHAADPWKTKELAILYLGGFIAIGLLGSGRFSVDHFRKVAQAAKANPS